MHDNFYPKTDQLRSLEAILINSAEKLGYNEVRTPILENLNLSKKLLALIQILLRRKCLHSILQRMMLLL